MADLFVRISRYARSPIMVTLPGLPTLERAVAETLHVTTSLFRSLTLARVVTGETLHVVSDTVTRTWQGSGIVTFQASAGHATVTGYAARLYTSPADAFVASSSLGVPTPDGNGVITADLTSFFAGQAAGDYTLRIRATDAGGFTDSPTSSPFTLPLP